MLKQDIILTTIFFLTVFNTITVVYLLIGNETKSNKILNDDIESISSNKIIGLISGDNIGNISSSKIEGRISQTNMPLAINVNSIIEQLNPSVIPPISDTKIISLNSSKIIGIISESSIPMIPMNKLPLISSELLFNNIPNSLINNLTDDNFNIINNGKISNISSDKIIGKINYTNLPDITDVMITNISFTKILNPRTNKRAFCNSSSFDGNNDVRMLFPLSKIVSIPSTQTYFIEGNYFCTGANSYSRVRISLSGSQFTFTSSYQNYNEGPLLHVGASDLFSSGPFGSFTTYPQEESYFLMRVASDISCTCHLCAFSTEINLSSGF